jgi:Transcriptional antiterminator
MIIKKILNNNAIVTSNDSGREIIAVGRGIAFSHKTGDSVSDDVVQKVYTLSNPDVLQKFEQLIASISIEYVQVSNEIIELAEKELDCKFNDIIYISLTDHIHMAVYRIRNGMVINNVMLWEVCKFYEREFLVAQRAVTLLNARFQVNMPEDEAGFIACISLTGRPIPIFRSPIR